MNVARSLEELEGVRWGDPERPGTRLIDEVHRLRRVPIGELTVEDLRLLIGQEVSLPIVMPLAVERLEEEPLVAGHMFEGDLLAAVLQAPESFWSGRPDLAERLSGLRERSPAVAAIFDRTARGFPGRPRG